MEGWRIHEAKEVNKTDTLHLVLYGPVDLFSRLNQSNFPLMSEYSRNSSLTFPFGKQKNPKFCLSEFNDLMLNVTLRERLQEHLM